jgi:hypothetical protein
VKAKGSFIEHWIKDLKKKRYTKFDFLPTGTELRGDRTASLKIKDKNVKNSYEGLKIEHRFKNPDLVEAMEAKMKEDEDLMGDKYSSISPILSLIWFLSGGEPEVFDYVLRFIGLTLLYPACLAGVFIIFKSIPGVGKNMFWDWIGRDLIGGTQYICSASESVFFDKHTTELCEKVLVMVNEMSFGVMKKHLQELKEQITEPMRAVNPKNEKIRWFQNCMSAVGGTNAKTPMPLESEDRRMVMIECSNSHKDIPNFFTDIVELQKSELTSMIFYTYIKEWIDKNEPMIWKYDFQNNRPKTEYQIRTQNSCLPLEIRFWKDALFRYNTYQSSGTIIGDFPSFLEEFATLTGGMIYKQFQTFCEKNKEGGGAENNKSATAWGSSMTEYVGNAGNRSNQQIQEWLEKPANWNKIIIAKNTKITLSKEQQEATGKKQNTVKKYKVHWDRVLNYLAKYTSKEERLDFEEVKAEYLGMGQTGEEFLAESGDEL